MRTVIRDLEMFPRAYAIPSQWPTNPWQRDAAVRTAQQFLGNYRGRILPPVNTVSASKLLLQKQIPGKLPAPLANHCRMFAYQVAELVRLSVEQPVLEEEIVDDAADTPAQGSEDAVAA
jgi:hypothetical protein